MTKIATLRKQILDEVSKRPASSSQTFCSVPYDSKRAKPSPKTTDHTMYFFRKYTGIGASSVLELNKATDDEAVGVQNFNGNKLPTGQSLSVDRLAFGYATAPTANAEKSQDQIHVTAFPAILRNSDLIIKQGQEVRLTIPMSELDPRTIGNNIKDSYYEILNPFKLSEDTPFNFEIRTPEGATSIVEDHFFHVRASGQLLSKY